MSNSQGQIRTPSISTKKVAIGARLLARAATTDITLLQLHCLHRSSTETFKAWRDDAKGFYQHQFDALSQEESNVRGRERNLQTQKNATALVRWSKGTGTEKANGDIKRLSKLLYEVQHDLRPDGSCTRIVQGFDDWYARSTGIQRMRSTSASHSSFVEGIGDGWKAEAAVLATRATSALNQLRIMGDVVQDDSDLKRLLELLSELLFTRLHELEVIQAVENQIDRQEAAWMHTQLDRIDADVSNGITGNTTGDLDNWTPYG